MRELEVFGDGHLKLAFAEWKDFFEQEMAEQVRALRKVRKPLPEFTHKC